MEEEFKIIEDHPNYLVSNLGRVKRIFNGSIVNGYVGKRGYVIVDFRNRKLKTGRVRSVHQLVGLAFLPNPDNKPEVDHIDRDKTNNVLSNLRWVNSFQNGLNMSKYSNALYSSIYKGVCKTKNNKWQAQVSKNNKTINIGTFATEREAGIAYNNYYIENNLTEYAYLNVII